jgi:hypothetical protein
MPEIVEVYGAAKPGRDQIVVPTFAEGMIESLLHQRTRYEAEGDEGLMAKVDETVAYYRGQLPALEEPEVPPEPTPSAPREALAEMLDIPVEQTQDVAPVSTEPGCTNDACVLVHPHAGPAIVSDEGARAAGLVKDRPAGGWREPRKSGRIAAPGEIVGE